ncbi:MAG: retention module-containing protein, partial [Desulfotalea sp.]
MAQVGKIQATTGLVTAKGVDGQSRELQVGDIVYSNEIIETATGATVSIIQDDGNLLDLAGNEQLSLDESVTSVIDPSDAGIDDLTALQQALVDAIENDGNIEDLLEDTAAGDEATTTGADGAFDFRSGYYAGDASEGGVGSYLLGTGYDNAIIDREQFDGDDSFVGGVDEFVSAGVPIVTIPDDNAGAT